MDTKQIADSNRLIAEFMGWKSQGSRVKMPNTYTWVHVDNLMFHKNWNSLMPVVEKIEALGVSVTIKNDNCIMRGWCEYAPNSTHLISELITAGTKLSAVYQAVVAFIRWHNQQTKDNASN